LKVPSATTKGDHNLLINPFHPEFKEIKIVAVEPFPFDNRLFRIDPSPPMVDPLDLQQQPSAKLPKKSKSVRQNPSPERLTCFAIKSRPSAIRASPLSNPRSAG
jgi:hypothetical protein